MYQIESTKVPFPPSNGRPAKYPFDKMAVGDSFVIPVEGGEDAAKKKKNVIGAAKIKGHLIGAKFTARIHDDLDGRKFVRCWRIA